MCKRVPIEQVFNVLNWRDLDPQGYDSGTTVLVYHNWYGYFVKDPSGNSYPISHESYSQILYPQRAKRGSRINNSVSVPYYRVNRQKRG